MESIKAIIVDDEESARSVLNNLLQRYCPNVIVIDKFSNVEDAVEGINTFEKLSLINDKDVTKEQVGIMINSNKKF